MSKSLRSHGTLTCIVCKSEMVNLMAGQNVLQPMGGLAFHTYGHYGSRYFDPMDGSSLHIAVCDECVHDAVENKRIAFERSTPPEQER